MTDQRTCHSNLLDITCRVWERAMFTANELTATTHLTGQINRLKESGQGYRLKYHVFAFSAISLRNGRRGQSAFRPFAPSRDK